jgi:hypothetical protein
VTSLAGKVPINTEQHHLKQDTTEMIDERNKPTEVEILIAKADLIRDARKSLESCVVVGRDGLQCQFQADGINYPFSGNVAGVGPLNAALSDFHRRVADALVEFEKAVLGWQPPDGYRSK